MNLRQWLNHNKVLDNNLGLMRTVPARTVNADLHNLDDYQVKKIEGTTCWLERKPANVDPRWTQQVYAERGIDS